MKEEIKKRFIDILFEPEEEEIIDEKPLSEVKKVNTPAALRAKDILYSKSNENKSFIDIANSFNEKKEVSSYRSLETSKEKDYEIRQNLSPMFGYIDRSNENEKQVEYEKVVPNPLPKKRNDSYLGTIISPFTGNDVKNDFSNTMSLSIHKIEKEDEVVEKEEIKYDPSLDKLTDSLNVLKNDFVPNVVPKSAEKAVEDFFEEEEKIIEETYTEEACESDFKPQVEEESEEETEMVSQVEEEPVFEEPFIADQFGDPAPIYENSEDFNRFREHTGDTEEIDLLEDLFPEEEN